MLTGSLWQHPLGLCYPTMLPEPPSTLFTLRSKDFTLVWALNSCIMEGICSGSSVRPDIETPY